MARYSDSEEDRKKHKKKKKHRSRSKSPDSTSSYDSHYRKKSKSRKKHKRKSPSPSSVSHTSSRRSRSRGHSSRRSRSVSRSRDRSRDKDYDRYRDYEKSRDRDKSKEKDRDRYQRSKSREKHSGSSKSDWRSRRSRSRSRGSRGSRRSRSWSPRSRRSRSRSRGSKRSRSRSRALRSRSKGRSRSSSLDRKSRKMKRYEKSGYYSIKSESPEIKQEVKENKKDDLCAKIPGFAEMEPSEQAKIRLKMALQAAAAADEQLRKMQEQSTLVQEQRSVKEQPNFAEKIEDIESSGFTQSTFQSGSLPGRAKQQKELSEEKSHDDAIFGVLSNNKLEDKINTDPLSEKIPPNIDTHAHPSLFIDANEKKKRWIQKLCAFRKKKLTGVILT